MILTFIVRYCKNLTRILAEYAAYFQYLLWGSFFTPAQVRTALKPLIKNTINFNIAS